MGIYVVQGVRLERRGELARNQAGSESARFVERRTLPPRHGAAAFECVSDAVGVVLRS